MMVGNVFDAVLRRTSVALFNGSDALCQAVYGYDHASRLAYASDGYVDSAAYSYLANSPLAGQITFSRRSRTRMTTTKQYDYLNRLGSIASSPSNSFTYEYNAANQRTLDRLWDGSYWRYGYDALGQVVSGNKYWSDMTPVAGQQFGYAFDTIGNRTQTEAGGDQTGASLRVAHYTNNTLNQITSRDFPGYVDIMGDSLATNTVSVTVGGNNQPAYQKVECYRAQLAVPNTTGPQWPMVTVSAPGQASVTGHVYVAQTPENYSYDYDGNLLSDGRRNYTWDAENRLISMTSLSGAPSGSQLQLAFAYDYQGRRIQKVVSTWNGNSYVSQYTDNYAYDGWNCIAVLNPSLSLLNSFVWGSDLSGSMQGAGGVGGLIQVSYYGTATTNCFVAFDGNGNVSALVNAADGTTVANYDYGPFGELIRATGPMAKLNPKRFQTVTYDDETDLLYYGYRYCNPSTGRWLSRDPIGDWAFFEPYAATLSEPEQDKLQQEALLPAYLFVANAPIGQVDPLGLVCSCCCPGGNWSTENGVATSGGFIVGGMTINATLRCKAAPGITTTISAWAIGGGVIAGMSFRTGIMGSVTGAPQCADLYGGGGLRLYSFGLGPGKLGVSKVYITIAHSGASYALTGVGTGVGFKPIGPVTVAGMYVSVGCVN